MVYFKYLKNDYHSRKAKNKKLRGYYKVYADVRFQNKNLE